MASSNKELRQRVNWAISRVENQIDESQATIDHLAKIRDDLTERIEGEDPVVEDPVEDPIEPAPEPDNYKEVAHFEFISADEPGWLTGEANGGQLSIGNGVGRFTFPAGWEGGREPGYVSFTKTPESAGRVRASIRTRVSPNFQGHHIASKWGFIWTGGYDSRPGGRPKIIMQLVGGGQEPIRPAVWLQGVQMEDSPQSLNLTQNVKEAIVERGEWFNWQIEIVQNTLDNMDGEIRWWVNGELVGEYTEGIRFTWRDEKKRFQAVTWRPVWGGRGGTIEQEQWMECTSFKVEVGA